MKTLEELFKEGLVKEGDIVDWKGFKYKVVTSGPRMTNKVYGECIGANSGGWINHATEVTIDHKENSNPFLITETTYKLDRRTKILVLDSGDTITLGGGTETFELNRKIYITDDIPTLIKCLQNFYDAVKKKQTQ